MPTLRRSCSACAKFKHSCDRRTPSCSRCIKRKVLCVYANQPLTAQPVAPGLEIGPPKELPNESNALIINPFGALDPFDAYPQTRLPREHVQRLIYGFLHKIAFQYYPLDLNAVSNPFLVSWWPLALGDPALFHVSLQTACLDEELLAQKGFQTSEALMADSLALLRRKVQDTCLAVQDGTINSVITLASIEFGKGNTQVSETHVDGVKALVNVRGGINAIRQTSPLTARMVSWVSMVIMGHPQFETQDDVGIGDGIPPIPEWQLEPPAYDNIISQHLDIDKEVENVFNRLRNVFHRAQNIPFSSTQLHDLACFVIHRLLNLTSTTSPLQPSPTSECVRFAMILYMFTIHGPSYYPHAMMLDTIVARFKEQLERREDVHSFDKDSFDVWFYSIGMVASSGSSHHQWFMEKANNTASSLRLQTSEDAISHTRNVLWLENPHGDELFEPYWDAVLASGDAL